MKAYVIILLVVLAFTCWLNDSGVPPFEYQTSFTGVKECKLGMKREAGLIPELSIVDKPRAVGLMTRIDTGSEQESQNQPIDLPLNARN